MNDLFSPKLQQRRAYWISMHVFALVSLIAYQSILIFHVGLTITVKGLLIFLLQIAVYLANVLLVIPIAFHQSKYPVFAFRLTVLITLFILVRGLIIFHQTSLYVFILKVFSPEQQFYASLQLLLVLGISSLLGFYKENEKSILVREAALKAYVRAVAEKERIKTISYQMQLNPHITFNTLNAIKIQTEDMQPNVAVAAQLLGNILRRTLIDHVKVEKIALDEVIAELKDLISLYQHLHHHRLCLEFKEDYQHVPGGLQLPPGILLTLADNMFKYGYLHDADFPGSITVEVRAQTLVFSTFNYKRLGAFAGSGMGLKNVRAILQHFYPGRHRLDLQDREDTFSLFLSVEL